MTGENPQTTPAKYRGHTWINIKTLKPIFSIQARVGKNGWAHAYDGLKPMFYDREADRDAKLKEMNHG